MYSDRDYFEEKFKEIDKRFNSTDEKLDKMYACIYGNGEMGLVDKVREQGQTVLWNLWGIGVLFVFLLLTHAKELVDFITELMKKKI